MMKESKKWKTWRAILDFKTCLNCRTNNGKIYSIYENRNGHLPMTSGRIWYEADINYEIGYRGAERILFSNDGLIFVTYDHYHTFIEIE